jgi:pimeloyl-ACP methyl ester carboxylesterase
MHIIFLPGGGGAAEFWHSLGALLPAEWKKTYFSWPGLGKQVPNVPVNCFDDLVHLVEKEIDGPVVLIAQSMGGVVGIRLALKHPLLVTHLILVATSVGVDIHRLGGEDWRPDYLKSFPEGARWITEEKPDHASEIPEIACPTLLLWGSRDSISPVSVGEYFLSLLPNARLRVIEGGEHTFARDRAAEIAPFVMHHLAEPSAKGVDAN